ncbi:hypothetical protein Lal_00028501 [Lupinus albus]|uniref:Putative pectinesterase inhibitor domain-containing protein n=1 Tax=Lupinus albus TaxID=3870 RepID=A0A6A4NU00_LUPAL|nr:putative pectinesterase inhibitor domain-containing protein [Lupinus albus]KAE9592522.1 putative pectinesterase inhibitor domain-containing protein [Lupinus albus]KAF1884601.1 hypothetical protein Lal_00028482 [Lupinus albus]KAF1884620.1 hypothetical protein Lal_00028501 [Lupinus albus]
MNTSFLFTLSLVLTSYAILPASSSSLFEQLCIKVKETGSDERQCLHILNVHPKLGSAKNYNELSKNILQLALKKSIEAQNFLKEVIKTNPSAALRECATIDYDGVVASFRSSLSELKEDTETANYDAKVGGDGPTTCDRALAAEKINNPAIAALNKDILLLSNIAFLATDMLP